jgi:hypothetical protein
MQTVSYAEHSGNMFYTGNLRCIHEEITSKLKPGNACCQRSRSFVFSFASKNVILLFLYWCESWPFTIKEEHQLSVLKNMVLRKTFGPKRDEVTAD